MAMESIVLSISTTYEHGPQDFIAIPNNFFLQLIIKAAKIKRL